MTHPKSSLPQVTTLPPLDDSGVEQQAQSAVAAYMTPARTSEDRARLAAELIANLAEEAEKARAQRDAAAYTLETRYWVRRGASIPRALGVGRTRWQKIRNRQAEINPRPVPNAPTVLPRLARKAIFLAAQVDEAIKVRDAAVKDLFAANWTNVAVARLIDRDPARVSHVRHRKDEAMAS